MTVSVSSLADTAAVGNRNVARAATSPSVVRIGKLGFVARGAVYLIVGWLALEAAIGIGATVTDKQGALEAIAQQPQGAVLLGVVSAGLFAYALWSLIRAAFDPERRGHKPSALLTRMGFTVAAVSYAGLALASAKFALGWSESAGKSSDASTQDWTVRLMNAPFGPALVVGLGGLLVGLAAMEFVRAYSADFRKDLRLTGLGSDLQRWIVRVGRMGFAARGVVFGLIGVFLIQASRHNDASEAIGLGGALQKLADQSQGQLLLGVVAAGLAMYGLFSLVEARYRPLTR